MGMSILDLFKEKRDPEKLPISELTEDELADLHVRYARPNEKPFNADLSDDAWRESEENEQKELDRRRIVQIVEGLAFDARMVRILSRDRDQIPADRTIGFVSDGGLENDPVAALIAVEAYESFPKAGATPENVLEKLIDFFSVLESRFEAMGVKA